MTNGIILLNKPKGWTSQDCVNKLRKIFKTKQIGHTGTLDPLAEGVLLILVGNPCKLCDYFVVGEKEYEATVEFGIKTHTLDLETEIIEEENTLNIKESDLLNIIPEFSGNIKQVPPMSSAIKVDGVPLYKLDRQGIQLDIPPRDITIHNIDILETYYKNNHFIAKIKIRCSHGTYIRCIARDLGKRLGTFATMTDLVRTENFGFKLSQCANLKDITESPEKYIKGNSLLKQIFPYLNLTDKETETISYGQNIPINKQNTPLPVLAFRGEELVSIGSIQDCFFNPKRVFVKPQTLSK